MSFTGMSPQTTDQKIESILEQVLWLGAGLPLPDHFKSDVNKLLATSGLSEDDQRRARRKFRKLWRKLARVTPKQRAGRPDRTRTSSVQWLVGPGQAPRGSVSEERKRLVAAHFRRMAIDLARSFNASLSAHEGVKRAL